MKTVDIVSIKKKFGHLLSYAVSNCGLDIDILNQKIIGSRYFDFLENGDSGLFLSDNISDICVNVLGSKKNNLNDEYRNDLVYCGESYISCSVSLNIPLRKLIYLFPISEMLKLFPIFHEMNPYRLIEEVNDKLKGRSSFGMLLEDSLFNINQLSKLLGCDRRLLTELRFNSAIEEKLSFGLVKRLSSVFGVDELFFSKSDFHYYSYSFWKSEQFVKYMKSNLSILYSMNIVFADEDFKEKGNYILLDYSEAYIYREGKRTKQIYPSIFELCLSKSIEQYREYCFIHGVAFC